MNRLKGILHLVRNFLFNSVNKEFLIFLFFLALSGIFWLIMTMNQTYEKELKIPVRIVNMPKNVVLTSDETDTIKATVRDKGWMLLMYMYGNALYPINVNFNTYSKNNGYGAVSASELQRMLYMQMPASSKITVIKPDKVEFFYNYGSSKRVPIRWHGNVVPEELYFISHVDYLPDSINVYASKEKLDSITYINTEYLNLSNFRDSLTVNCRLQKIRGVKLVPDRIKVIFHTDVLTEESMDDIPVVGINMPEGKVLRTFPAKVSVRFVTGVSQFRNLRPQDFTVVVDYNEIARNPSDKCKLYLKAVPQGITRATLETNLVDYLIEEQ